MDNDCALKTNSQNPTQILLHNKKTFPVLAEEMITIQFKNLTSVCQATSIWKMHIINMK